MGRKRERVLRVRYRSPVGPRSKLVIMNGNKPSKRVKANGRILRVSKVSYEELFGVGEYFQIPDIIDKGPT